MTIHLHRNDLPDGLTFGPVVAIDTETMGLDPRRDRLCVVQLSAGDGDAVNVWHWERRRETEGEFSPSRRLSQ